MDDDPIFICLIALCIVSAIFLPIVLRTIGSTFTTILFYTFVTVLTCLFIREEIDSIQYPSTLRGTLYCLSWHYIISYIFCAPFVVIPYALYYFFTHPIPGIPPSIINGIISFTTLHSTTILYCCIGIFLFTSAFIFTYYKLKSISKQNRI